jgi:hypothetical protein
VLVCCYALLLLSCASGYRMIHPENIRMYPEVPEVSDSIYILWKGNILSASGNRTYAKMEDHSRVSLMLIRVYNNDQRSLKLPDDLVFLNTHGAPIVPLTLEQAMAFLVEPVANRDPVVDVDAGIWKLGRTVNDVTRVKAHYDFAMEMLKYYLEDSFAEPQSVRTGFLALPIICGTPFTVSVR